MAMSEQARKRKSEYNIERKKTTEKVLSLHFQVATDMDVFDYIKSQPSKIEYIRNLVREDMKKNGH